MFRGLCTGLLTAVLASSASAAINVDIQFSSGSDPTDYGFASGGIAQSNLDGSPEGKWVNTVGTSGLAYWSGPSNVGGITGPVIYGRAVIDVSTFTDGDVDNATAMGLARDTNDAGTIFGFLSYFLPGQYRVNTGGGIYNVAVDNATGAHTYGWELDTTTRVMHLYFDDQFVGELDGYSVGNTSFTGAPNAADDSFMYFGDATGGGPHSEAWDSVVVQEGTYQAVPEPSALSAVAVGAMALRRRRRA